MLDWRSDMVKFALLDARCSCIHKVFKLWCGVLLLLNYLEIDWSLWGLLFTFVRGDQSSLSTRLVLPSHRGSRLPSTSCLLCGEAFSLWLVRLFIHSSVSSGGVLPAPFRWFFPQPGVVLPYGCTGQFSDGYLGWEDPLKISVIFSQCSPLLSVFCPVNSTHQSLFELLTLPTNETAGLLLGSLSHSCGLQLCAVSLGNHRPYLSFSSLGDHCSLLPLAQCLKTVISGMLPSSFLVV